MTCHVPRGRWLDPGAGALGEASAERRALGAEATGGWVVSWDVLEPWLNMSYIMLYKML